jgi:hypothetical protein
VYGLRIQLHKNNEYTRDGMSHSAVMATTPKRVALSTAQFNESLARYIEEAKPDPLATLQVEGWMCEWKEYDEAELVGGDHQDCRTASASGDAEDSDPTITPYCIRGTLSLHGDYMKILLRANCQWTWDTATESGVLEFALSVCARVLAMAELRARATTSGDAITDKKVRSKVLKRLQSDDYITKVLVDDFQPLCQATVLTKAIQLEERVWMDQDLLESIKRSIYSQASSVMDVVELVASFPYLANGCPLGHRAKLRLLEDAMLDACEREGDDNLIDELSLESNDVEDSSEHSSKRNKCK